MDATHSVQNGCVGAEKAHRLKKSTEQAKACSTGLQTTDLAGWHRLQSVLLKECFSAASESLYYLRAPRTVPFKRDCRNLPALRLGFLIKNVPLPRYSAWYKPFSLCCSAIVSL